MDCKARALIANSHPLHKVEDQDSLVRKPHHESAHTDVSRVAVLPEPTKEPQVAETSVCAYKIAEYARDADRRICKRHGLRSVLLGAFFEIDSEALGHSVERAAIYLEDFRGAGSTTAYSLKHVDEVASFQLVE